MTKLKNPLPHILKTLRQGFGAWLYVVKLTVPAMLLTRILLYLDVIDQAAAIFRPLMSLVGLPPEAALIWVTGMVASIYAAIAVFVSLAPVMAPLSLAQMTALCSMCLLAHSLIIEGQICRGAGLSFWRVSLFRIVMALIFGMIIHQFAAAAGWGAEAAAPIEAIAIAADPNPPWLVWLFSSAKQLLMMLALVETLMLFMELIKYLGVTRLIMKVLGPPLKIAGVGESAVMVTVIGCVVGLAYGGGLIVAESRSGRLSPRDIFGAMMLMAIFHSIFEDTFLMWAMGASLWWLLGARLAFALLASAVVTRLALKEKWRPFLIGRQMKL